MFICKGYYMIRMGARVPFIFIYSVIVRLFLPLVPLLALYTIKCQGKEMLFVLLLVLFNILV